LTGEDDHAQPKKKFLIAELALVCITVGGVEAMAAERYPPPRFVEAARHSIWLGRKT
jgi:hypothetical protein